MTEEGPRTSRQAEREYLRRSGAAPWERVKPFVPQGEINLAESLHLIQDFGACVALLDAAPHHRILDLGAGGCWASDWLQRLGLSTVSVDLSADLLALGRDRLSAGGRATVVCGDAEQLPFASGSFDRVLCLNALHHVPRTDAALAEIARVLTADGLAVFSEPGAGHASRPDAIRAVQDFGVQEADIEAGPFLEACRAAGFEHAVLEPFAHVVSGHGLTSEHWRAWRERASASRPRRALATFKRALLELVGRRKDTELFGEAFGSEALRVLGAAMHDHPIVVASKQSRNRFLHRQPSSRPPFAAAYSAVAAPAAVRRGEPFTVELDVRNDGTSTWHADPTRRGHVRAGAQLLDTDQRLQDRDMARAPLRRDVPPSASAHVVMRLAAPDRTGRYFIKIDLVSEGVTWFEPHGSAVVILPLTIE